MSSRFYKFSGDDHKYVSVTTFLNVINKPFLVPWAAKMERELINKLIEGGADLGKLKEYVALKQPYGYKLYTDVALEFGSKIHKAIDYTLKNLKLPRMAKSEKKVYDKWKEWWVAQGYILLGAEKQVRSIKHGYAGTEDALIDLSGKCVIDWKTGKSAYPEHILQNLAYQKAEQEAGLVDTWGRIVHIPKEGDVYTVDVPQVTDELLQPVLCALGLWRWQNNKPWKEEK